MVLSNDFEFRFVKNSDLSSSLIEEIYSFNTRMYPDFKRYYQKNRYYSSIKPQMVLLVFDDKKLIATGKFLLRKLKITKDFKINFFVFGFLVDNNYQKKRVGSQMMKRFINKAKEQGADILFGTTANPNAVKLMEKNKFQEITVSLTYTDAISGKTEYANGGKDQAFGYEFRGGLIEQLNSLDSLHLTKGPL